MIRLLSRATAAFRFAEVPPKGARGVGQHIKARRAEALLQTPSTTSAEDLAGAHRLLYVQFFPAAVLVLPVLFCLGEPTGSGLSCSLDLLQYYLSGLLCFNSFFQKSTAR